MQLAGALSWAERIPWFGWVASAPHPSLAATLRDRSLAKPPPPPSLTSSWVLLGTLAMLSITVRTILAVLAFGMAAKSGRRSVNRARSAAASPSRTSSAVIVARAASLTLSDSASLGELEPATTSFS